LWGPFFVWRGKKKAAPELGQAQPHLTYVDKKFGFNESFDWFGLNMTPFELEVRLHIFWHLPFI